MRKHKQILYVFVDYMCLAQGKDRSNKDKAEFRATLPNINLLYLGCAVLVLMFDKTCAWRGERSLHTFSPHHHVRMNMVAVRGMQWATHTSSFNNQLSSALLAWQLHGTLLASA